MGSKNRNRNSSVVVEDNDTYEGLLPEVETTTDTETVGTETVDTETITEATPTDGTNGLVESDETEETPTKEDEEKISEAGMMPDRFYGRKSDAKKYQGRVVAWDRVYVDRDFNIRDKDEAYTDEKLYILDKSLEESGQEEPMVGSLQPDGRIKTIRGNRRQTCMAKQRLKDLHLVEQGKMRSEDVRWSYVLMDVRKGLDTAQETVLMLDHGTRAGLEPAELFDAVVRLRLLGWGESQIKRKLGFRENQRGMVAPHWKIANMPSEVRSEYRKYLKKDKTNGSKVKFTPEVITDLYKAVGTDTKKGGHVQGGGEAFKAAWSKAIETSIDPSKKEPPLKSKIEGLLQMCDNKHHLLFNVFKYLLDGPNNLPSINDILGNIDRACKAVFPEEELPVTTVTEGNVTREI